MKNRIPIAASVVTTLVQLITIAGLACTWRQQYRERSRARDAMRAAIRLLSEDSPPQPHLRLVKGDAS